jgi:hypothetical protein
MKKIYLFIVLAVIAIAILAFIGTGSNKPKPDGNRPIPNKTIQVFFGNTQKNPNAIDCGAVFPVERIVSDNSGYDELLKQLFSGPTPQEADLGYTSFFSTQTADILVSVKTDGETAYVDLKDVRTLIPNASTSCGSSEFLSEIKSTLGQDGKIKKVILAINSDPAPFYEWLQIGCAPENNNCDASPFE